MMETASSGFPEVRRGLVAKGRRDSVDSHAYMAYTELDIKNKLFGAARTNNLADIKKLVGYISPDVKDATGRSALFGAAYFGFKDSIKLLLEQDADVNMADFEGCTPLHYACQQGNSDAVNSLCLGGALTTLVDIEGRSPAYVAALASKLACVRALVAHNGFLDAPPDNKNCAPLFAALAIDDNPELVKLLVEGGAKVDVQDGDGHTPLHHAAAKGRLEAAKVLLEHDADIYAASETSMLNPLHSAAFAGELELMKLLIRSTLDPETGIEKVKGGTEMFLNVGDANETTPLHLAALKGNVACVILLCESGAHVNVKDKDARTPLHLAAFVGQLEVVVALMKHKASVGMVSH